MLVDFVADSLFPWQEIMTEMSPIKVMAEIDDMNNSTSSVRILLKFGRRFLRKTLRLVSESRMYTKLQRS